MTDTQQVEEIVEEVAVSASLGAVLQAARDAKKLSQQDVSDSLRYSVKQVDALERDAFDLLPDAMITRGFIRNYARLLEIDAAPLLDIYRQLSPVQSPSLLAVNPSMQPVQLTKDNTPWLTYILGSILVLFFLLAWFVYIEYLPHQAKIADEAAPQVAAPVAEQPADTQSATEVTLPEAALPEAALPAAERQFPEDAVQGQDTGLANGAVANAQPATPVIAPVQPATAATPSAQVSSVQVPVSPAPVKAEAPAKVESQIKPESKANPELKVKPELQTSAGLKKVGMTATEKSWVRVSDKAGQILYEATLNAGDTQSLSFQTPFNVVIGNAKATAVNVSGQAMDLAGYTRNNVARISLE
ncbi:helix-turn-helix domain-containing protein [Methylotenera mobilis]|uniref:Cytoskeleton protein RodZ-like C-terminal domain-containing protein n=1 Tax=Methylotenera mobilis (strain JLW8 / ATCC BAA-1282 / DSM 17540) TaxID=583345 RepID=C6WV26_METML|nr:RodZ domain-containing protein [Methylotenera mobilis]ACT47775.1 conserved hypothetical protein [Methylotenera mobilis JLW8]